MHPATTRALQRTFFLESSRWLATALPIVLKTCHCHLIARRNPLSWIKPGGNQQRAASLRAREERPSLPQSCHKQLDFLTYVFNCGMEFPALSSPFCVAGVSSIAPFPGRPLPQGRFRGHCLVARRVDNHPDGPYTGTSWLGRIRSLPPGRNGTSGRGSAW